MNLFGVIASLALCLLVSASGEDVKSSRLSETAMLRLKAESLVKRVNSAQNQWRAELNPKFAEMDLATKRKIMGVKNTKPTKKSDTKVEKNVGGRTRPTRPPRYTTTTTTTSAPAVLPKSLDAREEWPHCVDVISQIQDQARCGSCWAVAAASTMSDRLCIHSDGKDKTPLSAADIMSCETVSQGCHGGYPDYAWKWYHDYGVVSGTNYTLAGLCKPYPCPPHVKKDCVTPKCKPECQASYNVKYAYDKKHAKSYTNWQHSPVEDIMQEIYDNGPVEADFIVYDDFMHYKDGVYQHDEYADELGGHAVRMIGWGEEPQANGEAPVPYWLIANSWNYDWGLNGTFKILRGQDECYIESWGINFGEPDLDH
jgi:cathepsin B